MKKGLIGKKLGMTHIFTDDGIRIPVTVVEAGPCVVLQKKTVPNDGYNAIQLGFWRFVKYQCFCVVHKINISFIFRMCNTRYIYF